MPSFITSIGQFVAALAIWGVITEATPAAAAPRMRFRRVNVVLK
jgi:hypothetical protein